VTDHVLRRPVRIKPDLLVLAAGIVAQDNHRLFELFKVPVNSDGFLVEAHAKLRPVDFASEGIFLAGLAHYPKPLEESIAQAKAAASRAMTLLSKEAILVGGVVATVDSGLCAACLTCVRSVPLSHSARGRALPCGHRCGPVPRLRHLRLRVPRQGHHPEALHRRATYRQSRGECHFLEGNVRTRKRVAYVQNILKEIGLEPERVQMFNLSSAMAPRFAEIADQMTAQARDLGPSPLQNR
jgi:hypothetical protein